MDAKQGLAEDRALEDVTTRRLGIGGLNAVGMIRCERACTIAGVEEAAEVYGLLGLPVRVFAPDGDRVDPAGPVLEVRGAAGKILAGERTALNYLMRMSGIATATAATVERCQKANPGVLIAATRKGTPGFREHEKRAVLLGGGDPHRFSLADGILVKDNHLALIPLEEAVTRLQTDEPWPESTAPSWARLSFAHHHIAVEVRTQEEARRAGVAGVEAILLDNPTVELARAVHEMVRTSFPGTLLELSGGITPENAPQFAPYGDVLSIGGLTHSSVAIPYSLDLRPAGKAPG